MTLQERGKSDEYGSWWLTLSAMLLSFAALEAYLNYIGPLLSPERWNKERSEFSTGEYQGTLGKLAYLLDECGLEVHRGQQPWQTIKELNRRRDKLMHPRSEAWDREITFRSAEELRGLDPAFYSLADEAFVDSCMAAIEEVIDPLHRAVGERVDGPAFGGRAFHGMVGHQGGSILG